MVTSRFITAAAVMVVTVNSARPNQHIRPSRQPARLNNLIITFHPTGPGRLYRVELDRKSRQLRLLHRLHHRRWIVSESILVNASRRY